jgi:alpha-amylase
MKVHNIFRLLILILISAIIGACIPSAPRSVPVDPVIGLPQGTDGFAWWNDTVFYQIFVRSFYDTTGDGIGDINGLIERLDYLNDGNPDTTDDLGITGLWLLPIHPSPSYHGYDVLDYYEVNPQYGTMEDFKRLLDEAHQRGIRVIIDLVLNHTSSDHPWFRASRNPESEYRDWYIWSETDPGFLGPWGQRVWHRWTNGYYYGIFWERMPDLNYENPEVTDQMLDVARFWLEEVGVDGFRIDGAQHLIEDGSIQRHTEATHEWFKDFRGFYKDIDPQAITVGEVWDTNFAVTRYVQGDQFDLAFNFDLATAMIRSANTGNSRNVQETFNFTKRLFPPRQYATFLTNHDIDRVMSQLGRDEAKARVAASMLLTAPGVPFIYYGEELGMVGVDPHENIRTPMQWSSESQAGFTTGQPWRRVNQDYVDKNVTAQLASDDSLLAHYRGLIRTRNQHAALRVGSYLSIEADDPAIYSFLRMSENEVVLVIINLAKTEITEYNLYLAESPLSGSYRIAPIFGENHIGNAQFEPPDVSANGAFEGYTPLAVIPPSSTIIVQMQSR